MAVASVDKVVSITEVSLFQPSGGAASAAATMAAALSDDALFHRGDYVEVTGGPHRGKGTPARVDSVSGSGLRILLRHGGAHIVPTSSLRPASRRVPMGRPKVAVPMPTTTSRGHPWSPSQRRGL